MKNKTSFLEPINEGLDPKFFTQVVDYCSKNLFTHHTGIRMTRLAPGKAYAEIDSETFHSNLAGYLHGGVTATLLDVSMGIACITTGVVAVTANMNISYLAAGEIGQKITAVGQIIRSGKTVMFTESYLENEQRIIIAKASAAFLVKGSILHGK
ncbi:MAG: PaaI family thioesterase [Desulfitobacteriaceae bacterium]